MKIKNVVCAPGRTGFYFDDQRAIKRGAGHDGATVHRPMRNHARPSRPCLAA